MFVILQQESLTSDAFYKRFSNIRSLEEEIGKDTKPRVSMYQGGSYDDPPPDMPSLLIDARIVYLGMAVCTNLFMTSLYLTVCFLHTKVLVSYLTDCFCSILTVARSCGRAYNSSIVIFGF